MFKFLLFYINYFNIFNAKVTNEQNIFLMNFSQTLGVELHLYYNIINDNNIIEQINTITNKVLSTFSFDYNLKKKTFFILKKTQTDGIPLNVNIEVLASNNSELDFTQIDNVNTSNKKTKSNLKTINLYGSLKFIQNLNIKNDYKPDYNLINLDLPEWNLTRYLYDIYYRITGVNKKYSDLAYINDNRNYTMGDILGILNVPLYIFYSGKGEETFVYVGVHDCNVRLISILIIQFDIYGKIIKYYHNIPLCQKCHNHIKIKKMHMCNFI